MLLQSSTTTRECAKHWRACSPRLDIAPKIMRRRRNSSAAIKTEAACLLVDIQLGDISGLELSRHLSATGFEFPIIFMTGSDEETQRRQAMDFGCVAYLQKPLSAEQLVEALSKAGISCVSPETVKATSVSAAAHRKQCEINAASCGELARKAFTDEDRKRWLSMQRFWLERASLHDDPSTPYSV